VRCAFATDSDVMHISIKPKADRRIYWTMVSLDTLVSGSAIRTFKCCPLPSCTSPECFRANLDACVKKTLETNPKLVQISAAKNS
jgi:hypothetical protein